jgi:hypothetical protein
MYLWGVNKLLLLGFLALQRIYILLMSSSIPIMFYKVGFDF